jgi:gluconokinase
MTVRNVVASLEVSTSSAKCMLFSEDDGVISEFSRSFARDVADGPTQSPDGVVESALVVLHQAVQWASRRDISIAAVGLAGTWHSLLLLDAECRPLGAVSTWADLSAAPSVTALRRNAESVANFYHKTGCMVHAMYPVWKWFHLRRTQPEVTRRVAFVSSQIEYVFQSLTGCRGVSKCTASGTGLFNINTLDWDDDVLEMVGVRREQLSPLHEAFHSEPMLASVADRVGLPSGVPITVGCADGAMNQVGAGGVRPRTMSMSVGTSGALRAVHDKPRIPDTPSTWCYYMFGGKRLAGAAINNGTNCVDWFLSRAGRKERDAGAYEAFSRGAAQVDVAGAPFFMPFLFGERCPGWREEREGGFYGVRASHDEFDLYHAVLEGVLFNMRQCYEILARVGGRPDCMLVSGGILNSDQWTQMAADIFGRGLLATGTANSSTVGAALVALEAVTGGGQAEHYSPDIARTFVPRDPMSEVYDQRYQRYLELYEREA